MASISGIGGNSLNNTSGIRGFGGLASGLDRDTLIEQMTYATRSKISAQKQKQQTISWTQGAMRTITGKLYEFSNKYMSYSSSSNLLGGSLFSRNQVTAQGANSGYVSVSGKSTSADTLSILGVKSLAQNAQMTTNKTSSGQKLETGEISNDLSTETWADVISGESLFVKYGTKTYSVTLNLDDQYQYDEATGDGTKAAADLINRSLAKVSIGNGKTLGDVMKAELDAGGTKMKFVNTETAGNTLRLAGSTGDLLKDLGFLEADENLDTLPEDRAIIDKTAGLLGVKDAQVTQEQSIAKQLSGKKISFSYNGTAKWITLDQYDAATANMETVRTDIQKKLDESFGKGRITVGFDDKNFNPSDKTAKVGFTFTTTKPGGGADGSSVLAITGAERGILGNNSIFHIQSGTSNRLNLSANIGSSGLTRNPADVGVDTDPGKLDDVDASGKKPNHMVLTNGGVTVDLTEKYGLNWDSSVNDIINRVNGDSELGITITYQSNADKFVVQAKESGASGAIKLEGNLSDLLFGKAPLTDGTGGDYQVQQGQDAVITVKYAGSGEVMDITRGSNTITIDGLNVTVKGEFGYKKQADGSYQFIAGTEPITFDAQVDAESTTKVVKEMIDAYNEALKSIHTEVNQKPNRNYAPLTDEQKKDMSESQIEKWETEAKKGVLFNDTDVRGLADELRFVIPSGMRAQFEEMGVTVSTDYSDNGKLVFDEAKFKAALQKDPEAVKNAFAADEVHKEDGTVISEAGMMTKMKTVMDRYASMTGATKGILVERAGSVYAPTTILKNSMQKQMDDIDKVIKGLNGKLKMEQDRYVSQFTALETLISQMNSQSSYLSSMFSA